MSRILVTGGSGFIGYHILPLLVANGSEVHAVCRSPVQIDQDDRVHWHQGDLLERQQARDLMRRVLPDQLVHLAWYTDPPMYWDAKENSAWVEASITLFREFAKLGGQRIIAVGSCAEYDWSCGPCNEDSTALEPVSLYGKSKKALHLMLAELAGSSGIAAAWARVFFPYGPGEHPSKLITYITTSLLKGEPAYCSTPDSCRDFIFAADVGSAMVAILESGYSGAINIGSGEAVRVGEVAERVAQKIGRPDLLRFTTPSHSPNNHPLVVANISRLRGLIRWTPAYSLDQGIERTIEYCVRKITT